jgi:hypothetical protein
MVCGGCAFHLRFYPDCSTQNLCVGRYVNDNSAVNLDDNNPAQHGDEDHAPSICYRACEVSRQAER